MGTVISLRSDHRATSALAAVDVTAMELLREGRAATLSAARLDAILANLRAQRGTLIAVIDDLELRSSSGDDVIDVLNANLSVEAQKGLASIDAFIQHAEACAAAL